MKWVLVILIAACGPSSTAPQAPRPLVQSGSGSSVTSSPPVAPPTPAKPDDGLGTLTFEVTGGTPAARRDFELGMLAMHSFWYEEAKRRFAAAVTADPSFVMGHWGVAMAHAFILFNEDDLVAGRAALAKLPALDKVTAKERAWVAAAKDLYVAEQVPARRKAFLDAMERMHRDFPDDDEVATFLSLALISYRPDETALPVTVRARAGSLALEVLAKNPKHPGAAHYVIHAFDTPDLAEIALPAALRYAKIAPGAYHARHMPAHIFGRLGRWKDAQASCRSAWDVSVATGDALHRDYHSLSWLVALGFELGRRGDADGALKTYADAVRAGFPTNRRGGYIQVVQVYLGSTEQWDRADELLAPLATPPIPDPEAPKIPDAPPDEVFERLQLATLRAQLASERKDPAGVTRYLDEAEKIQLTLKPFIEKQIGKQMYADQEKRGKQFSSLGRAILLGRARRDPKAMLQPFQKLIALMAERPEEEPGVMGGSPHEGLAEVYMDLGKPKEALAELRIVLVKHPNRARVLLRAARAAAKAGEAVATYDYYAQLLEIWNTADPNFPGLDEAKQAVAKGRPQPSPTTSESKPAPTPPVGESCHGS
jgi:tetratricopeptide (TPR) repeat protein